MSELLGRSTSTRIYEELFKKYEKKLLDDATLFTNFEYLGLSSNNELSRRWLFDTIFVSKAMRLEGERNRNIEEKVNYAPGIVKKGTLEQLCLSYDARIGAHRPFLGIQTVSPAGEFAGICPEINRGRDLRKCKTGVLEISDSTAGYLMPNLNVPYAVTIGLCNILENVRNLIIPIIGEGKSIIANELFNGNTRKDIPLRHLREHNNLILVMDKEASKKINTRKNKEDEYLSKKIKPEDILSH